MAFPISIILAIYALFLHINYVNAAQNATSRFNPGKNWVQDNLHNNLSYGEFTNCVECLEYATKETDDELNQQSFLNFLEKFTKEKLNALTLDDIDNGFAHGYWWLVCHVKGEDCNKNSTATFEEIELLAMDDGTWAIYLFCSQIDMNLGPQPSAMPSTSSLPTMSASPSILPSAFPSLSPTSLPNTQPSYEPSKFPSTNPSIEPSQSPSYERSKFPSTNPSNMPSSHPSLFPSLSNIPSFEPSSTPSDEPSDVPAGVPSSAPSSLPSSMQSNEPSRLPSSEPSLLKSSFPSKIPSSIPSFQPSLLPSNLPSNSPSNMSSPPSFPTVYEFVHKLKDLPSCYEQVVTPLVEESLLNVTVDGEYVEVKNIAVTAVPKSITQPFVRFKMEIESDNVGNSTRDAINDKLTKIVNKAENTMDISCEPSSIPSISLTPSSLPTSFPSMAPTTKFLFFEYATDIFYSVDKDCMKQELVTITTSHVEEELPKESNSNFNITTDIQVKNNDLDKKPGHQHAVVAISVTIYSDTALDEEYLKNSTGIGIVKAVNSTSFNNTLVMSSCAPSLHPSSSTSPSKTPTSIPSSAPSTKSYEFETKSTHIFYSVEKECLSNSLEGIVEANITSSLEKLYLDIHVDEVEIEIASHGLHADKNETVHGIATISVTVKSYYAITDFRTLNKTVDDAIRNAVNSEAFEKALADEESCEPQQERLRNIY